MGLERGVIVVSFGERWTYINSIVVNIHKHWKGPILLVTDEHRKNLPGYVEQKIIRDEHLQYKGHKRWGVRNCNIWSAWAALNTFDSVCVLNDDMRIVSDRFVDGFGLAEKFGVCVPMNPRVYVKYNSMGADTTETDRAEVDKGPIYGPACNMSPMFACRLHDHARLLLSMYIEELHVCMRGTLAFWLASYRSAVTPLYLPEQWCVCGSSAQFIRDLKKPLMGKMHDIEPIMLHWGQPEVRKVFEGMVK